MPSRATNQTFLYVLALAAARYRVQVHAFCVLSNHFHLVVTDPDANLPAFQQFLDALVARAVNASLGRWEAFWAPDTYSAVRLVSPTDVVEKAAYVLAQLWSPLGWPWYWACAWLSLPPGAVVLFSGVLPEDAPSAGPP